jgi:hypothetical protein
MEPFMGLEEVEVEVENQVRGQAVKVEGQVV